jgi:class 3 adenylate cyclase
MAGFTAISERLGEEGTFALVQPIYELLEAAVREQGGSVKDFTGDAMMALFGAPDAQEDAAGLSRWMGDPRAPRRRGVRD